MVHIKQGGIIMNRVKLRKGDNEVELEGEEDITKLKKYAIDALNNLDTATQSDTKKSVELLERESLLVDIPTAVLNIYLKIKDELKPAKNQSTKSAAWRGRCLVIAAAINLHVNLNTHSFTRAELVIGMKTVSGTWNQKMVKGLTGTLRTLISNEILIDGSGKKYSLTTEFMENQLKEIFPDEHIT